MLDEKFSTNKFRAQPFIKYVQSEYTINKGVPTES